MVGKQNYSECAVKERYSLLVTCMHALFVHVSAHSMIGTIHSVFIL